MSSLGGPTKKYLGSQLRDWAQHYIGPIGQRSKSQFFLPVPTKNRPPGKKTSLNQRLGANSKKLILAKFCYNFVAFSFCFQLFA